MNWLVIFYCGEVGNFTKNMYFCTLYIGLFPVFANKKCRAGQYNKSIVRYIW